MGKRRSNWITNWRRFSSVCNSTLLEISEGIVFVHSETWNEDFISDDGVLEWLGKGIDIENDSDTIFYEKLKKQIQIESKVITSHWWLVITLVN